MPYESPDIIYIAEQHSDTNTIRVIQQKQKDKSLFIRMKTISNL